MKNQILHLRIALALLVLSTINHQLSTAFAQGTAFTYQGRLYDGTNPANGNYDLRFAIYDSFTVGTQQGGLLTNSPTAVSNGLFTVTLDFGNQFPGASRWLEIAVRTNNAPNFFTLSPRQALTPAPYAITAGNVISGGLAAGVYGSAVTFNNANNNFSGSFSGNGANVTNVNAATLGGLSSSNFWNTAGNAGTAPGANFIGTTDNQPLNFRVNNTRAFHLEPTGNDVSHSNIINVLGGSPANVISSGIYGATIAGGGAAYYFGFVPTNTVTADFGTISGGYGNSSSGNNATVGGGYGNTSSGLDADIGGGYGNLSSGGAATIAGGYQNVSSSNSTTVAGGADNVASGQEAAVGGGQFNIVTGRWSTIAGGQYNIIGGDYSVIVGGYANTNNESWSGIGSGYINLVAAGASFIGGGVLNDIQTNAFDSLIGGGNSNTIQTNATYSAIGGGALNTIQAYGEYDFIGGGEDNTNSAVDATIGGGYGNLSSGGAATIGGGYLNVSSSNSTTVAGGAYNVASGQEAAIGGGQNNTVTGPWSTIAGGSDNTVTAAWSSIAGGQFNIISGDFSGIDGNYSVIGGGYANTNNGVYSGVGSGLQNFIDSSYSFIGGGGNNDIQTNASGSFIGGGGFNMIQTNAISSAIVDGSQNTIQTDGAYDFIGGGQDNVIQTNIWYAVIGGGRQNTNLANGFACVISGGLNNNAGGFWATVPGGLDNAALGRGSFAAGTQAQATNDGAFVLTDAAQTNFYSTTSNQLSARFTGGVRFVTGGAGLTLDGQPVLAGSNGTGLTNVNATTLGGLAGSSFWKTTGNAGTIPGANFVGTTDGQPLLLHAGFVGVGRSAAISSFEYFGVEAPTLAGNYGGMYLDTSNSGAKPFYGYSLAGVATAWTYVDGSDGNKWKLSYGFTVAPSGNVGIGTTTPGSLLVVGSSGSPAYCNGTTWQNGSDRNSKEQFAPVNPVEVLEKVSALPITEWKYKVEANGTRHLGPVAQDFHAAFDLNGPDDTHIATVDEGGVALVAIQGLNQKLEQKETEITELKQRLDSLEKIIHNQKPN